MTLDELYAWGEDVADGVRAQRRTWAVVAGAVGIKRRGTGSGMAKLTDDTVREIRTARAAGELLHVIAARHGVHKSTIQYVLNRGWRHVL